MQSARRFGLIKAAVGDGWAVTGQTFDEMYLLFTGTFDECLEYIRTRSGAQLDG